MNASHDYDKILTRLVTILHRLYEGEALSVKALAEEFGVSTKTIQRDFNERLARFPLEKEGRRWRLRKGFRIEKVSDLENTLTLQVLESLAAGVGGRFAERSGALLGKLKNGDGPPLLSYLEIEDITDRADALRVMESAISARHILRFEYNGKPRETAPYRILNFDGYWYLLAFEFASGLAKKFYIRQIKKVQETSRTFEPDKGLEARAAGALNVWFDPNVEPFELTLLASSSIAKYLSRRPLGPGQSITARYPNGDLEVVLKATTVEEALALVKKWLPDLRVLAPSHVKEAYETLLKKSLAFQTGHDAV
ncbi:MAG: WYL domain-containing protein [Epsilonproteobacteria bacterium]|nr:WYL domain-containing protein [Campylobacterota bacterium]